MFAAGLWSKVHQISLDAVHASETDNWLNARLRGIRGVETTNGAAVKYPFDIGLSDPKVASLSRSPASS